MLISWNLKKYLLILIAFAFSFSVNAEKLYWVGGSGNWDDVRHWSTSSGGSGGAGTPSASTSIVFDRMSSNLPCQIKIQHGASVKDIDFLEACVPLTIDGPVTSSMHIGGSLEFGSKVSFQFLGDIFLTSSLQNNYINFYSSTVLGNIIIDGAGSWKLSTINLSPTSTLTIKSGNITLNNAAIYAGNLIVNQGNVNIQSNKGIFNISNRLILGSNVNLDATELYVFANTSNPSLFSIHPNVSTQGIIYGNNDIQACTSIVKSLQLSPVCAEVCTGSVRFTLSGCAQPSTAYTVSWVNSDASCAPTFVPPSPIPAVYNQGGICCCGSSYNVIFLENGVPFTSRSVTITCPTESFPFFTPTEPTCMTFCDGTIDVFVTGGQPNYSLLWTRPSTVTETHNNIAGIDALTNACVGTYTLQVTDANGCVTTNTVDLTEPTELVVTGTFQNATCFGVCNGSAAVSASGGTQGYTYQWDGVVANNNDTLNGLCGPSTHSVLVTDARGCIDSFSANIIQPTDITYTMNGPTMLSCSDVNDGTASVTVVSGATPNYSYAWSGPLAPTVVNTPTSSSASNMTAGTYSVVITDALGCDDTATFIVAAPAEIIVSVVTTDVNCFNGSDGTATASNVGGTGAVTYTWFDNVGTPIPSPNPITILSQGTYSVVATDANGCDDTTTFIINEPPALVVTATPTNPSCFGLRNGQVCGSSVGGTGAVGFTFTPLVAGGVVAANCYTNLPTGPYTVTGTDANGCTATDNVVLTSPTQIDPDLTHTDPTCDNACNGTASTNASGGNGAPFTYAWSCDVSTTPSISNLCAGKCVLTVTDALGCTQKDSVTLIDPVLLTVTLSNTNVNCSGGNTAQITSVVSGGTPLYNYLWAPGGELTPGLSNVGAGTYDVLVTDSKGCSARDTVIVTSPPAITITTTPTDPTCFGDCDGSITTVLGGGTSPYTQTWLPNNSTNLNQVNLCDGSYTIDVTDALGCTQSATVVLTEPGDIIVTTDTTLTTCIGTPTGTATASAVGGDGNYTYSWNPTGQVSNPAIGLVAGTYIVTVTDGQGCTGSASATVTEPTAVTVLVNSITPSCSNICNGTATIVPNGGTGPYTYTLDGGASFPGTSLTNLCTGNHTVVITDANGCTATTNFIVPIQVTLTLTTSATLLTCNGDCNGTITANVVGATGVPTFLFDAPGAQPDQFVNPATGLCAGIFTVTVTDAIGCQVTSTVTFTDPPVLTAVITESPVDCDGNCIGVATAAPSGGIAPYTVTWSNGLSSVIAAAGTSTNSNLCFGTYTATITDANGCTINPAQTANITQPSAFTVVSLITPPTICGASNGSITVTPSGVGPYTYSWSAPGGATPTLSNIPAGAYDVTITDNVTGCDTLISFALSDPNGPTFDSDSTNVTCPASNNGTITINVLTSTGVPTITFLPLGAPLVGSPQTAVGLDGGVHIVKITDATGCQTFHAVTITEPNVYIDNEVLSHVSCNGGSDGSITLNPTGGTAPFTYTVDGLPDDNVMTGLNASPHLVIPTDANGCTYPGVYTLTEPIALTLTEVHTNANCVTGLASATITTAGGTAPFTYVWSGPTTPPNTANPNNLVQGTYTCDVTDGNGCTATINFTVGQNPALVSGFTFTDNLCSNGSTGTATFNASGGSGVYTYTWSNDVLLFASSQNGISPGNYSATVSDDNGCSVTENYTIGSPTPLTVTLAGTDPTCNGAPTGCITATPSGGTAAYSYVWTGAVSATQTVCNLAAGNYTVDVTDANGCVAIGTYTLTDFPAVQANVVATQPTCFGTCNGILDANPIGGVAPYTFFWGPAPSASVDDSLAGLCIGTYYVIVTDANGCEDSVSTILTQPAQLGIAASTSPATCGLVPCDGCVTINNIIGNSVVWLNSVPPGFTGLSQCNLCAGVYDIEVSDINGCKDTSQVLVSSDAGPVVNVDSTNTTCIGDCDGKLTVVSVVGIGPFTYSWQPGIADVDSIAENLCDGPYISQVTDAAGCITLTSIDILDPTDVADNEVITNASCNGINDGSIILTPTGGTGVLTYAWSNNPGLNSPSNIGIGPGSYTVDITDANLCTYQFIYNVGANAAVQYQLSVTNTSCFGQCDGTATLNNIGGGTAPYLFSWNDGQASASATSLCAGNYSVTITDAAGCSILIDTTITQPTQVVANPTITNTACGVCAGSVALVPAGGTGAFTYLWGDGQSASTAINLCAGVHTVDVRDANGCLSQFNVAVNNTNGPTLTVNSTDVNCAGQCTGTASVVAAGGTTPYQYNWIAGGQTTSAVANLCAGTYFVQVKDAGNCLVNDSVVINETNTITANISATATNCGASTGQAVVAPSGATAPYTFEWSNASTNDTISNLPAGNYWVEITDATSCKDTFFITINSANGPIVSVATDSVLCNGASDGSATLTINGGNPGYTVLWSTGSVANPTLNGLDAGNYSVSVTDATGCVSAVNFTIDEPNAISLSLNNTQLPTCQAACNGALTAIPNGGTLPYTYLWIPGNQTTVSISNQCAGLYGLTVTDAKGCTVSQNTQLINNPNPFNITEVKTDATCGVCDGTSVLTPNGGQAPYTYLWSQGDTDSSAIDLCAGVYMVDIADALGCTQQYNVAINNINGPTVTASSTDVTCSGLADGTASTVVAGGTTPYQYNWINGGQITSAVNGLAAGTYFVQVKDASNCVTNAQVTINETTILNANAVVTSATCGANDGAIDLTPTGGLPPYTFVWSHALLPTEDQTNLAAGNYSVEITDAGGCKDTVFVSISSTNAPGVVVDVDSVSCNGLSDGSATLTINGGTPGYTVLWSTGSPANPTLGGLSAGNYAVSVTDAAGCISAQNFTIEEPIQLALSLSNTQLPNCSGVCNGALTAIPNGGSLAYTYLWMPGNGTADTIAGLCAGSYTLTVTDANSCVVTQTTNLNDNPVPFNIDTTIVSPGCNLCDGTIDLILIGGASPYSFNWSSGDTLEDIANVCAGVYQVDITDSVGCSQTATFAISNLNGITDDVIVKTDESCFGTADGTATVTPVGGTPGYTYLWPHNGATVNNLVGLAAGTYFLEISDTNNCIFTSQVDILSPNQMTATTVVVSPNCAVSDGSITLNVSGGTGVPTYVWNPAVAGNTNVATNLPAGVYTITVTDASAIPCSQDFTVALGNVNGPQVDVLDSSMSCNGVCDGSVSLVVTSVNPTGIVWNDLSNGLSITNLCEGTYTAVITDLVLGCSTVISATITEPDTISFGTPISTDLRCFGICVGSIAAVPFGGTLPYTYAWAPSGETGPLVDSLCAGVHTLTITDNNGCIAIQNTTITEPTDIVTTGVTTPSPCSSVPTGAIDVTVNGGAPFSGGVYTYQWIAGSAATTQDLNAVLFGNYTLEVTDSLLCKDTVSFNIATSDTVVAIAGTDAAFCTNDNIILDGSASTVNNGTITYEWSEVLGGNVLGITDSVTIPGVAGTTNYQLIVTNSLGCSDTDTVAFTANLLPVVSAGPDLEVVYGITGTIGGSPTNPVGTTLVWTPNLDLSSTTIPNPVSSSTLTTTYLVTVTDTATGCIARDSMVFVVLPDVIIPNGISPNGDGKNDTWIIDLITKFPENEVEVYNRWGEQLYYKKNYDNTWDGTYKGKGLPVGTYYYVVKLNDPKYPEPYTGPITIFK